MDDFISIHSGLLLDYTVILFSDSISKVTAAIQNFEDLFSPFEIT